MTDWKKGDLCMVSGEGETIFRVREATSEEFTNSCYLEDISGRDGEGWHGREGVDKMRALPDAHRIEMARRMRRVLRLLGKAPTLTARSRR